MLAVATPQNLRDLIRYGGNSYCKMILIIQFILIDIIFI